MNKSALDSTWNQLRQKYGVYLRVLEALPEDKIHEHVIPGMRTPVELAVHTSRGIVQGFAEGVARGEILSDQDPDAASKIVTKADLLDFAKGCWEAADAAIANVGDDELNAMVKTPFNMEFPGSVGIHAISDELVHHRGQLYAYIRACGAEPPMVWSHGDNAPGFGPTA